jgi:hypothetical protein
MPAGRLTGAPARRAAPVAYRCRQANEEEAHEPCLPEQCPCYVGAGGALVEKDHAAHHGPRDARHEQDGGPVGPVAVGGQAGHQEHDQYESAHRVGQVHRGLKRPAAQLEHGLEPDDPGNGGNGQAGDGAVEAHTGVDATER